MNPRVTVCALSLLASCTMAQPIRVLTLDASRTDVCSTIDFNVLIGNAFVGARALLDNPANFGPGGTIDREIEWTSQVPMVTREALQGCDLVLLSTFEADAGLDVCERRALLEFIESGGGVFWFENGSIRTFGLLLGATPASVDTVGNGAITDESSPVADGPFGPVAGSLVMAFHKGFDAIGPNGSAFAASSIDYGATFEVGTGRVVLYGDEESFMTIAENGCAFGTMMAKEQTMFLNAVAYLAPEPGFQFTGSGACCPADANQDGSVNTIDVLTFLNQWTSRNAFADINGDGAINTQDLLAFLNLWNEGC